MARASTKKSKAPLAREPGLSRERVCREALALVDEEGLDALSMRRLGARLGVEAMSLYRHVRNKADLLASIHDAVLADMPSLLTEGDWRACLGGFARNLREALLRHPNVVALFATSPPNAPESLAVLQRIWAALEVAGFEPLDAQRSIVVVGVFTIGHTLGETQGEPAAHLGVPMGPGVAEFEFGLEALLDGIASRAAGPQSSPGRRGTRESQTEGDKVRGARKSSRKASESTKE